MNTAKFTFTYGPMGSGKSQDLIRIWNSFTNFGRDVNKVLVLTSRRDTRSGTSFVKSRASYRQVPATCIEDVEPADGFEMDLYQSLVESSLNEEELPEIILVDEIQFMTKDQVHFIKNICMTFDIPVIAFGLMKDFQNNIFEGSQAALIVAETITEIKVKCSCQGCRKKAIMNLRIDQNGNKIEEGEQIVAGDAEYRSVCHEHWENWSNQS